MSSQIPKKIQENYVNNNPTQSTGETLTPQSIDPMLLALHVMFQMVDVNRKGLQIVADTMQGKCVDENRLISRQSQIHFQEIDLDTLNNMKHKKQSTFLASLNANNQEVSAERDYMSNKINLIQQDSSTLEAKVSNDSNSNTTYQSQFGAFLHMLSTLTQQISRIVS